MGTAAKCSRSLAEEAPCVDSADECGASLEKTYSGTTLRITRLNTGKQGLKMKTDKHFEEYSALATLPLRDVVVYPHMVLPLFVGRPKSIAALD